MSTIIVCVVIRVTTVYLNPSLLSAVAGGMVQRRVRVFARGQKHGEHRDVSLVLAVVLGQRARSDRVCAECHALHPRAYSDFR